MYNYLITHAYLFLVIGTDSRRASAGSGATEENFGTLSGGVRRFTKGFIRLPSLRRQSADKGTKSGKGCKRTDRTSKMLIAVLLLFLLTEFPQGIMHFLTGMIYIHKHG